MPFQPGFPRSDPSQQAHFGWGRVDAFIDAVDAIAATLLVPRAAAARSRARSPGISLIDQWPTDLVYALGVVQIVAGWGVLRRVSAWSRALDHYAMLLVMVTMMTYSLQPFSLAVLTDAVGDRDDLVAAIRLMAIILLTSMDAFATLMVYLRRRDLFRTDALDLRRFEVAFWLANHGLDLAPPVPRPLVRHRSVRARAHRRLHRACTTANRSPSPRARRGGMSASGVVLTMRRPLIGSDPSRPDATRTTEDEFATCAEVPASWGYGREPGPGATA